MKATPFSPQTRIAILAEFRAAHDRQDANAVKAIYRAAADHDETHPGEDSLVSDLLGLHIDAMWMVTA